MVRKCEESYRNIKVRDKGQLEPFCAQKTDCNNFSEVVTLTCQKVEVVEALLTQLKKMAEE